MTIVHLTPRDLSRSRCTGYGMNVRMNVWILRVVLLFESNRTREGEDSSGLIKLLFLLSPFYLSFRDTICYLRIL